MPETIGLRPLQGILGLLVVLGCSSFSPAMSEPAMDAGLQYYKKRDWRSATFYFEQAVKNSPWDSTAMYYLALSYHNSGFQSKAKNMYQQIVDKYPGSTVAAHAKAALQVMKASPKTATRGGVATINRGTGSAGNVKTYLSSTEKTKAAKSKGSKSGK